MLMSLGEIPGMRDAWAMVSGSIFVNFCLASVESDLMSLYTSLPFNFTLSRRRIFSAITLSRSM